MVAATEQTLVQYAAVKFNLKWGKRVNKARVTPYLVRWRTVRVGSDHPNFEVHKRALEVPVVRN
jgi:hypothetical protein